MKKLTHIKSSEEFNESNSQSKADIKKALHEELAQHELKKHQEEYEACLQNIDDTDVPTLSKSTRDYGLVLQRVKNLVKDADKFYVGTTSNYNQRFCGDYLNPDNPVHTNCHSKNGYTTMYVLGKSYLKPVICWFEETLLKDLKGLDNDSEKCLGLVEDKGIYFVYVIVKIA